MKFKNKILSILLAAALVLSLIPFATLPAWAATKTFDISLASANITEAGDYVISGTTDGYIVTVDPNIHGAVNITLLNVSINNVTSNLSPFSIGAGSTVNLTLIDDNFLVANSDEAALSVPSTANLVITAGSTGSLTAIAANNGAAGIGGNNGSGGSVTIDGGTVTATGGLYAAGIGGGNHGSGGTVTINGGTVTANGGDYAAGIGGGTNGNGGTVTVSGGTVKATGSLPRTSVPAIQAAQAATTAACTSAAGLSMQARFRRTFISCRVVQQRYIRPP